MEGGIAVPEILGSRSTDLRAGLGGYNGRTLQPADSLYRQVAYTDGGDGEEAPRAPLLLRAKHDPLRAGTLQSATDIGSNASY
eukprot:COSAG05_NODE_573_length_8601_cov_58.330981_5_plen_83_part_00